MFLEFAYCLALSAAVELLLGLIWRVSNRDLNLILLVNCLTNPAVRFLTLLFPNGPSFLFVLGMESIVILAEAFCYQKRGERIRLPLLFSLLANCLSYLIGLLFSKLL